jgi:hypothetical protein
VKAKKTVVSAAVAAALLMNLPQVSAEKVETFGDEFDKNNSEVVPFQDENEDFGPTLTFNNPNKNNSETPEVTETPAVNKAPNLKKIEPEEVVIEPAPKDSSREKVLPQIKNPKNISAKGKRFVKVAMDEEGRTYYIDKQNIKWKRLPYSASEYILDCWVRIIERNPDYSNLPNDLEDYINDGFNGEIELAQERKSSINEVDMEVLKHKKYFLQHYYIRPKTKQIQFLCELEVVGHPQNTVAEREYDYKNWENLIPSSIESMIYHMTLKSVSMKGSSEKGRMSVADMFDEYLRISIR